MTASHAGRLLVATPILLDPNFELCVMLLLEHGEEGALGVILDRPSELAVADALSDWAEGCASPAVVFAGGPVEREALIALGRPTTGVDGALVLGLHSVDLDSQPALARGEGVVATRIFAGYAGWSPGQLDDEVAEGAWWLVDAEVEDVFTPEPSELRARVLRRAGGELSLFAHYPLDLSVN